MNADAPTPPTLRILAACLLLGQLTFAIIVAVLIATHSMGQPQASLVMPLGLALAGTGLGEAMVFPILRRATIAQARKRWESNPSPTDEAGQSLLLGVFSQLMIIGMALAEGFGLFGSVTALVTGRPEFLVAPAIATVVMALMWPTQDRMEKFVRAVTGPGL